VFPYENLVKNLNLEIERWKINIYLTMMILLLIDYQ
jgi:hypothetical protein